MIVEQIKLIERNGTVWELSNSPRPGPFFSLFLHDPLAPSRPARRNCIVFNPAAVYAVICGMKAVRRHGIPTLRVTDIFVDEPDRIHNQNIRHT